TLATVASLLKSSPGKFQGREVYFLTDLQRSSWIAKRPGDLASALATFRDTRARAVFVDVGVDGVNNLAVTHLQINEPVATTTTPPHIQATFDHHGDTRDVPVRLSVGRAREKPGAPPIQLRQVAETTVRARRGQQTFAPFTYKFRSEGDHVIQVQAAADALVL